MRYRWSDHFVMNCVERQSFSPKSIESTEKHRIDASSFYFWRGQGYRWDRMRLDESKPNHSSRTSAQPQVTVEQVTDSGILRCRLCLHILWQHFQLSFSHFFRKVYNKTNWNIKKSSNLFEKGLPWYPIEDMFQRFDASHHGSSIVVQDSVQMLKSSEASGGCKGNLYL